MIASPSSRRELADEVQDFLFDYARAIDQGRFRDWLGFFTEDAVYSVMTHQNKLDQGLYLLYDSGLEALKERAAYCMGYWQSPRGKMLHTISNIQLDQLSETEARVRSYLVAYRTGADGVTVLHACGECEDMLVKRDSRWQFRQRAVVVDNDLLPPNFTELL